MKTHPIRKWLAYTVMAAGLFCPASLSAQSPADDAGHRDSPMKTTARDDMFIDLIVPMHQIYLGETIRIQYDVYVASHRGQVNYIYEEPDFAGWYTIEDEKPIAQSVNKNGKPFTREPFAVFLSRRTSPGESRFPSSKSRFPIVRTSPGLRMNSDLSRSSRFRCRHLPVLPSEMSVSFPSMPSPLQNTYGSETCSRSM